MDNLTIKPIETKYKGYRFRSRLEARWAVFFDKCGFKWEYEPEGYEINGVKYLPDFRLYNVCWPAWNDEEAKKPFFVEVKGHMDDASRRKIEMLSQAFPVYVVGNIPFVREEFDYFFAINDFTGNDDILYFSYNTIYGNSYHCGLFVNKQGRPDFAGGDEDTSNMDIEKTIAALEAARAARFEHGEGL